MKAVLIAFAVLNAPTIYAETLDLEAIEVVRGNKDKRTYLETNESISLLKPKSLNRGDLENSVQMLNGFANVQTQTDKNGDTFSIRGISDMGVTGYQKDNLASTLVDDVFQTPLSLRAGSFDNWDLETIEIRRGAQSTDQGVNSLAGNILLYHSVPANETSGAAKLGIGNFGRFEGAIMFNKTITERFFFRTSYNKENSDGFIKNSTTDNSKWGERKKDHFVLDFLYQIAKDESLRLNFKILRNHKGGSYVQNEKKYKVFEEHDHKDITNNQQASLTHEKRLYENFSNKVIFAATRASNTGSSDEDGTPATIGGHRDVNDKDYFLSLENQLRYKSDKINNVTGLHFHKYYLNNFHRLNLIAAPNAALPVTQENSKERETYALFNSLTYDFTQHHALTLGARYEVVKNYFGAEIQAPAPYASLSGLYDDDSTNSVFLPKLGYTYRRGKYSLGATYSQGYRTGGVSINRLQAKSVNYDPEKTHNYELSWKFLDKGFSLAANTFYTNWKDQQVEVVGVNTFDSEVKNAAGSELYGAELEAAYDINTEDSLRFNIGYVKTRFLTFKDGDESFSGNAFPDSAPITAQTSYWNMLTDKWMLIFVSRYVSESYTNPQNDRWAPEQFYFDINTQYNLDQYMVEFYVKNIFDQQYRLFNGSPRPTATTYLGNYHRMSSPREFGLRINYYW